MPFSIQLQENIEAFLSDHELSTLYKKYEWRRDEWDNGFPDMRQLETDLTNHAKQGYVTRADIMNVAVWGGLRNKKRVKCPELVRVSLYHADGLSEFSSVPFSASFSALSRVIEGMGPTYFSKILMFSQPQLYGAIDTRLVRVFGRGDARTESFQWLSLAVRNYGSGWFIPEHQTSWPSEYDTWLDILHHIASLCNSNGHKCPHPDEYVTTGMREKGRWIAADVETALFSYASSQLQAGPR